MYLSLAGTDCKNSSFNIDTLIEHDYIWDIFETEIIHRKPGWPAVVRFKFGYILSELIPVPLTSQNIVSILYTLKWITEFAPTKDEDNNICK